MTTRSTPYSSRRRVSSSDMPGERGARWGDREDRVARLDQRQRAVLEVGGGVGIGRHLGQLLELERPLACRGVLEAPPQHDAPVELGPAAGHRRHVRLAGQRRRASRRAAASSAASRDARSPPNPVPPSMAATSIATASRLMV